MSLWERFRAFIGADGGEPIRLSEELTLHGSKALVLYEDAPIEIRLGPQGPKLLLFAHVGTDPTAGSTAGRRFVLAPVTGNAEGPRGSLLLAPGRRQFVGLGDAIPCRILGLDGDVEYRHACLTDRGDSILVRDTRTRQGTIVRPWPDKGLFDRIRQRRLDALRRIREIFGGPLRHLPPREAKRTLDEVNDRLLEDAHRPRADTGHAGGLVILPPDIVPIIVGDLHAQVDNLLKILCEDRYLEGLFEGWACLIVLGDAVHSEIDGEMDDMDSSVLMMDLIFKLKIRFPDQVYYIRGNHDSFSAEMQKGGVLQGFLWEKQLEFMRGDAYVQAMNRFYDRVPYAAVASDFVACHAGPPRGRSTREQITNILDHPRLARELMFNRIRRSNYPAGYSHWDVKRFRKVMGVAPDTPLIVGHNPLTANETLWLDAGRIANHHIVYSGRRDEIAIFTRIGNYLLPQIYKAEPMLGLVDRLT